MLNNKPITTRGFTGHEQLAEVGLIHMNGRIYDGALGRFVQADPIIQEPMRVQSLNRYSYVWNNPLNATDPSGFCSKAGGPGYQPTDDTCPAPQKEKADDIKNDKKKDSGLKYKITDQKVLDDWLKKNGKTMDDFTNGMKDKGVSKASFKDSSYTVGGVFMDKKGRVATVINQSGGNSASANEAFGSFENRQSKPNGHLKDKSTLSLDGTITIGRLKISYDPITNDAGLTEQEARDYVDRFMSKWSAVGLKFSSYDLMKTQGVVMADIRLSPCFSLGINNCTDEAVGAASQGGYQMFVVTSQYKGKTPRDSTPEHEFGHLLGFGH